MFMIRHAKNSLSHIAALPLEVHELVSDWAVNLLSSKLSTMQVSKQWRNTALRSQVLWNCRIAVDEDFTSARKSFARVGNRPIRLPHRRTPRDSNICALDKDLDFSWLPRIEYLELGDHKSGAVRD
jgi:hypothetical protein